MATPDADAIRTELTALGFTRAGGVELEGLRLRNIRRDELYEHSSRSCVALFRPGAPPERTVLRLETHLSDGTVIQTVLDDWMARITLGPFSSGFDRHLKMKVVSFIGDSVTELSKAHVSSMNALARELGMAPRETRAESIGSRIERAASSVAMAAVLRQIAWLLAIVVGAGTPFLLAASLGFSLSGVPLFIPVGLVTLVFTLFVIAWIVPILVRATPLETRRIFGEPALAKIVMPTKRAEALFDDRPPFARRLSEFTSSMRRLSTRRQRPPKGPR